MLKFLNILKANDEVKNLNIRVEDLVKDNQNLLAQVEDLKQREAAYSLGASDWIAEKEALINAHAEVLKTLEEKYNKEIDETKASVSKQASQIVSSMALEPETIKVSTAPTEDQIVSKFNQLKGEEGIKYYMEHQDVLRKNVWKKQ